MMTRKRRPDNFRAIEWAQGPEQHWSVPFSQRFAVVDATDKYRALSGKLKRACASSKVQCPRPLQTDKAYDMHRASAYFEAMTGLASRGAMFAEHCVHGEKRPRIRYVLHKDGKWEIPNWDWNGHNQTPEECELHEARQLADVFA